MRVKIENNTYQIDFTKEIAKHQDGSEKINTICKIVYLTPNGTEVFMSDGVANLNYKDKYNKITGKKIALKRALENSDFFRTINCSPGWNRRIVVWKAFKKEFGIEK